jgi:hypothetical protein
MRWKDAVEKDIKILGRNASLDMALSKEKWRGLGTCGSSGSIRTVKLRMKKK